MVTKIPNDVANQFLLMGIEDESGVAVVPDFRVNGTVEFPLGPPALTDEEDVTGTYMRDETPARGIRQLTGNFNGVAEYETLPSLGRLALVAGATPAISANPAYTYEQAPALAVDAVDTATIYFNHQGNGFAARGCRFNELNIAGDTDNAAGSWMLSGPMMATGVDQIPGEVVALATGGTVSTIVRTGAAWTVDAYEGAFVFLDYGTGTGEVRQIDSNTADTLTVTQPFSAAVAAGDRFRIAGQFPAGVPVIAKEKVRNDGTRLFIDTGSTAIGTTQIRKRFISFNVTVALALDPKRFMEQESGEYSGIYGRGRLRVTYQIRLEFDRYDELQAMKNMDEMKIRIESLGKEIAPGVRKLARLDILRGIWNEQTRDTRNNNLTQTLSGRGYLEFPPMRLTTRNGIAVLP